MSISFFLPQSDLFRRTLNGSRGLLWRVIAINDTRTQTHTHTHTHTPHGSTPLDEGVARRRDLYLTTYKPHKRQTLVPLAGFEYAIPASKRPQPYALDRAAREMFLYVLTGLYEFLSSLHLEMFP
jgi:hypothetical protein